MYSFLLKFINSASNLVDLGRREEKDLNKESAIESLVSKEQSIAKNKEINSELEILAKEFGELSNGKQIEIELNRILLLLPRKRRKVDAYKGIRSVLKRMGVELIIKSKKRNRKWKQL